MKEKKSSISHEELQRAVSKFINEGGIITKLPDQKALGQHRVGGKWATTEMSGDLTS
ncbi:MAG: hypothetical protein V3S29_11530 [bacterium]